jgi:hypothetical protein
MKLIGALVVFALAATSLAADPQHSQIVARVSLINRTVSENATLYTPSEDGLFRISAYGETISSATNGGVTVSFNWKDDATSHSGLQSKTVFGFDVTSDAFQNYGWTTLIIRGKAGSPISSQITLSLPLGGSATYSVFFVVERLSSASTEE